MMKRMIERYIESNKLQSRVKVLDKSPVDITVEDLDGRKVCVVVEFYICCGCLLLSCDSCEIIVTFAI